LVAALRRAVEMQAEMPHNRPMRPNTFMRVQRVLMPESSAASGLPPMAKT
jgi:hypothetical protein